MRSGAGVMNSIRKFVDFPWIVVVDDSDEVILLFSWIIDGLKICILYGSILCQHILLCFIQIYFHTGLTSN